MFLETWMLITLALLFGFCAYLNRKQGVKVGINRTLQHLEENKIIQFNKMGEVFPGKRGISNT